MSDFIDVKSPKAKGKRFSTLDIERIEDITPEPQPTDEDNNEDNADDEDNANSANDENGENNLIDVPFTITNEVPEDSKPIDEQLSLF